MRHLSACLLVTAVMVFAGCAKPMTRGGGCGPMGCPSDCATCPSNGCMECGGGCGPGGCMQTGRAPMLEHKRMYGRSAPVSREGMCPCGMCKGRGCAHCGGRGHGPCGLYGHHHDLAYRKEAPPYGPPSAAVAYPYYTTRGPRDFLVDNPPSIGPY